MVYCDMCKHFRFQIPHEDANFLRQDDPEPCTVCDNYRKSGGWCENRTHDGLTRADVRDQSLVYAGHHPSILSS